MVLAIDSVTAIKQVQHQRGVPMGYQVANWRCGGRRTLESPEVGEFPLQETDKTMSS